MPRVDREWWDDPRLRPSLAIQDVQALFVWLQRHGFSQAQIAAMTGQSQPEVSAIIKGRKVVAYSVFLRIADGVGIPRGYLGLSGCLACDGTGSNLVAHDIQGDDPMFRRHFLAAAGAVAAGGALDGVQRLFPDPVPTARTLPVKVGAPEVAQVRGATAQFRALDYQFGYGTALDAARGYAGWAHGMLSARQSKATARELRIALADLHVLIAWAFHDSGRPTGARRNYVQAMVLAREADEPAMVGTILGDAARVSTDRGDPREGMRLAGFGLLATDSDDVVPAVRAALHLEEAWARARLADEGGTLDALSRAADDLARTDPAAVPAWASSASQRLMPGSHAGLRSQIYQELARTPAYRRHAETAVADAETALAAYDGRRPWTSVVLARMSLATGQLRVGARDDGLATANSVLEQAVALQSTKALARLADISDATQPYAGHDDADDLRAHIAALTAA